MKSPGFTAEYSLRAPLGPRAVLSWHASAEAVVRPAVAGDGAPGRTGCIVDCLDTCTGTPSQCRIRCQNQCNGGGSVEVADPCAPISTSTYAEVLCEPVLVSQCPSSSAPIYGSPNACRAANEEGPGLHFGSAAGCKPVAGSGGALWAYCDDEACLTPHTRLCTDSFGMCTRSSATPSCVRSSRGLLQSCGGPFQYPWIKQCDDGQHYAGCGFCVF
jgi:hypothetical protein